MADYYSILGLTKNATDIEIKTAFRKLAKIYHPDKNSDPNSKNAFANILKAYNILINPHSRKRYDNSNSVNPSVKKSTSQNPRNKGQKEWTTTDEDLKRRDYYKKHYHHIKSKTTHVDVTKNHYSDYKYILFATPIAVGLLMLIISLFNSEPKIELPSKKTDALPIIEKESTSLNNGTMPYTGVFGDIKTFDTKYHLQINNSSPYDAVIVVFDKKTNHYLQHAYLKNSYSIDFSMLPETGVYWKCVLGKNWDADKLLLNDNISGGFDSVVQYQNWKAKPVLFIPNSEEELTQLYVLNSQLKNKPYISDDSDFFEK